MYVFSYIDIMTDLKLLEVSSKVLRALGAVAVMRIGDTSWLTRSSRSHPIATITPAAKNRVLVARLRLDHLYNEL